MRYQDRCNRWYVQVISKHEDCQLCNRREDENCLGSYKGFAWGKVFVSQATGKRRELAVEFAGLYERITAEAMGLLRIA